MHNQPHLLNGLDLAANDALKAFDGESRSRSPLMEVRRGSVRFFDVPGRRKCVYECLHLV